MSGNLGSPLGQLDSDLAGVWVQIVENTADISDCLVTMPRHSHVSIQDYGQLASSWSRERSRHMFIPLTVPQ